MSGLEYQVNEFSDQDLEDICWFAESVVRVEHELKEAWGRTVKQYHARIKRLFDANLHV